MDPILHYVYDPLCGWCYAAESLVQAAAELVPVQLHAGGLFARGSISEDLRRHIRVADARIAELSGQVFSSVYFDSVLADPATVYDSVPPIAAVLAAEHLKPGSGLAMLRTIQHVQYRHAKRLAEPEVLRELAVGVGFEHDAFGAAFNQAMQGAVQEHVQTSRKILERAGLSGFPGFILQKGPAFAVIDHQPHYGQPEAFVATLKERLS